MPATCITWTEAGEHVTIAIDVTTEARLVVFEIAAFATTFTAAISCITNTVTMTYTAFGTAGAVTNFPNVVKTLKGMVNNYRFKKKFPMDVFPLDTELVAKGLAGIFAVALTARAARAMCVTI